MGLLLCKQYWGILRKHEWSDVLRFILDENLNSVAKKQNWGKDLGGKNNFNKEMTPNIEPN